MIHIGRTARHVRERKGWSQKATAEALGISQVHLLGYRDQQLTDARPDQIREQLTGIVRAHRPHLVAACASVP